MSDSTFTKMAAHLSNPFETDLLVDLIVGKYGIRFQMDEYGDWEVDSYEILDDDEDFPGIAINLQQEGIYEVASEFLGISLPRHFEELRTKTIFPGNAQLISTRTTIAKSDLALAPFYEVLPSLIEALYNSIKNDGSQDLFPAYRQLMAIKKARDKPETEIHLTFRYVPVDLTKEAATKAIRYATNAVIDECDRRSRWFFLFGCCVIEYGMDNRHEPKRKDILSLWRLKRMPTPKGTKIHIVYPETVGVCYSQYEILNYCGRFIALSTSDPNSENWRTMKSLLESDLKREVESQVLEVRDVDNDFSPFTSALREVSELLGYYTGGGAHNIGYIKGHSTTRREWLLQAKTQADNLLKHFEKSSNAFTLWRTAPSE